MPAFDPVLLELGPAGEDGERLVYCKYQRRVERFFASKGIPLEEARDLTQDTFMRVFRSEAKLTCRAELEAWVFEIARNVLLNVRRSSAAQKRAATVVPLYEPAMDGDSREREQPGLLDGERDALARAIRREQLEILRRALAELPDQMRECARLRLRGFKYREIAAMMRISIETVKTHLHAAKKRLRPLLEPHFGSLDF